MNENIVIRVEKGGPPIKLSLIEKDEMGHKGQHDIRIKLISSHGNLPFPMNRKGGIKISDSARRALKSDVEYYANAIGGFALYATKEIIDVFDAEIGKLEQNVEIVRAKANEFSSLPDKEIKSYIKRAKTMRYN